MSKNASFFTISFVRQVPVPCAPLSQQIEEILEEIFGILPELLNACRLSFFPLLSPVALAAVLQFRNPSAKA